MASWAGGQLAQWLCLSPGPQSWGSSEGLSPFPGAESPPWGGRWPQAPPLHWPPKMINQPFQHGHLQEGTPCSGWKTGGFGNFSCWKERGALPCPEPPHPIPPHTCRAFPGESQHGPAPPAAPWLGVSLGPCSSCGGGSGGYHGPGLGNDPAPPQPWPPAWAAWRAWTCWICSSTTRTGSCAGWSWRHCREPGPRTG